MSGVFAISPFMVEKMSGYHPILLKLADVLWLPGGLLATIFYPGGTHENSNVYYYLAVGSLINFLIYSLLFIVIIKFIWTIVYPSKNLL